MSLKNPLVKFLFNLSLLVGGGLVIRFLYHSIPGGISYVAHSRVIDTFYRILIGPVDFLLTLTGVHHSIGYLWIPAQYCIYLPGANVTLALWLPCLGISLMYVYTSLILAYPNPWKKKLVYIVSGILVIQVLNILRLWGLLFLIAHTHTTQTRYENLPWLAVNHETIFNYGVIFLIFLMFVFFARRSTKGTG